MKQFDTKPPEPNQTHLGQLFGVGTNARREVVEEQEKETYQHFLRRNWRFLASSGNDSMALHYIL